MSRIVIFNETSMKLVTSSSVVKLCGVCVVLMSERLVFVFFQIKVKYDMNNEMKPTVSEYCLILFLWYLIYYCVIVACEEINSFSSPRQESVQLSVTRTSDLMLIVFIYNEHFGL